MQVIYYLDCRAIFDALLTQLANGLDWKRLACKVITHVHIILGRLLRIGVKLKARRIHNKWHDVGINIDIKSRCLPDKRFFLLINSFFGSVLCNNFSPQILLPFIKIVLSRESLCITHSHVVQTFAAQLFECFIENFAHLVELLV